MSSDDRLDRLLLQQSLLIAKEERLKLKKAKQDEASRVKQKERAAKVRIAQPSHGVSPRHGTGTAIARLRPRRMPATAVCGIGKPTKRCLAWLPTVKLQIVCQTVAVD